MLSLLAKSSSPSPLRARAAAAVGFPAISNNIRIRGFADDAAKKPERPKRPFDRVTVFGAGLMGSGIVQVASQAGYRVTMVDVKQESLDRGKKSIEQSLARSLKKKWADEADQVAAEAKRKAAVADVFSRISLTTDQDAAVADADLVIEAVIEDMALKQKLFARLDAASPAKTIFATNTSALKVSDIVTATKRADRFGGLHYFNPVQQMPLVEVIRTAQTSDATFKALWDFTVSQGKVAVECNDNVPGFIVNHLLVPYLFSALRLYESGNASMRDIDTAMKLGAGYPMGPFELADYVGLDTLKHIIDYWRASYPNDPAMASIPASKTIEDLVKQGNFGRKTGKGFYDYTNEKPKKK